MQINIHFMVPLAQQMVLSVCARNKTPSWTCYQNKYYWRHLVRQGTLCIMIAWREISIRSNQNHAGRTMMPSGPVVYWKLVQKPTYSLTPAPPNPLFSSRSVVQRTEQICRRPATCPGALGPIWQPWATRLQELLNFHTTYTLTTFKLPELRKPSAHKFG